MEVLRNELELRDNPELLSAPDDRPAALWMCEGCQCHRIHSRRDARSGAERRHRRRRLSRPLAVPLGALIKLPSPLVPGDKLRARQRRAAATSPWTTVAAAKDHTKDFRRDCPAQAVPDAAVQLRLAYRHQQHSGRL